MIGFIPKKEIFMQVNFNPYNNRQSFGARLRFNSKELENLFSQELSHEKVYGSLRTNIEKFKTMYPQQIIEGNLVSKDSKKVLELYNPSTRYTKSFDWPKYPTYRSGLFGQVFKFLTTDESKRFWTDEIAKGLFV